MSNMKETWVDVVGYDGLYEISTLGIVKSKTKWCKNRFNGFYRKAKILKPYNIKGYLRVGLRKNSKQKHYYVHILMAMSFLNYDNKMEVNHIDHNKHNNALSNLEMVTKQENMTKAVEFGVIKNCENHSKAKLSNKQVHSICKMLESKSWYSIAKDTGINKDIIRGIYRRKNWVKISENYNF